MTVAAYIEGWESGTTRHWDNVSATGISASTANPRTGTYHLRYAPSASTGTIDHQFVPGLTGVGIGSFYFTFPSALPTADINYSQLRNAGSDLYNFAFRNSDDTLIITAIVGGVVQETAELLVPSVGTWYRIDWLLAGSTYDGGNERLDWMITEDGEDTPAASGTLGPNTNYVSPLFWRFGSLNSATYTIDIDDVRVIWTNTDADEAMVEAAYPLGPGYVRRIFPDGRGTDNNASSFAVSTGTLADSHTVIDDLPTTTATNYIEQNVVGSGDYLEYTLSDLLTDGSEDYIAGVIGKWSRRSSSLSANNAGIHVVDGSTDHTLYDSSWIDTSSPYTPDEIIVPVVSSEHWVPSGDADEWTRDRVDELLMRWGYSNDVDGIPRLPAFTVEVWIYPPPEQAFAGWGLIVH